MKKIALTSFFSLISAPAFASTLPVPEMDAGAGVAALALVAGAVALLREKTRRK